MNALDALVDLEVERARADGERVTVDQLTVHVIVSALTREAEGIATYDGVRLAVTAAYQRRGMPTA